MCVYVYMSGHVHIHVGSCGDQKRVSSPLELELQVVVSHLLWVLVLKQNSGPLEQQQVLSTTEPSLQAL